MHDTDTPAAITYGDRFTIPALPAITWELRDRRTLRDFGQFSQVRAIAFPVALDGEPIRYGDPVTIGRAAREYVAIKFSSHGDKLSIYVGADAGAPLTAAQSKIIDDGLAALTFELPALDAEAARALYIDGARAAGEMVAYSWRGEGVREMPSNYSDRLRVHEVIDRATGAAALDAAVEAFRDKLAKEIASETGAGA